MCGINAEDMDDSGTAMNNNTQDGDSQWSSVFSAETIGIGMGIYPSDIDYGNMSQTNVIEPTIVENQNCDPVDVSPQVPVVQDYTYDVNISNVNNEWENTDNTNEELDSEVDRVAHNKMLLRYLRQISNDVLVEDEAYGSRLVDENRLNEN